MQLRDHEGVKGKRDAYPFDPRLLKIIPNYNIRNLDAPDEREELDELKASIREIGVQQPLIVRFWQDDVYVIAGHRRLRAVMELIDEGIDIDSVLVIHEAKGRNDADRDLDLIVSNSGKPLTMSQKAEVIRRLLAHGWDETKIAGRTGLHRGTIANCIKLLEAPSEIQNMVQRKEVSATTAIQEVKKNGAEQATQTLKAATETARANGKTRAMPKHINRPPSSGKSVPQPVSQSRQELIDTLGLFAKEAALQNLDERDDDEVVEIKIGLLKRASRVHRKVTGIDP